MTNEERVKRVLNYVHNSNDAYYIIKAIFFPDTRTVIKETKDFLCSYSGRETFKIIDNDMCMEELKNECVT